MNTSIQTQTQASNGGDWYRAWLSPRRIRFWLLIALLLYTLSGFFLAPWLLERTAVKKVEEMGRSLSVGDVKVNPFMLTIQALDMEMHDTDGALLFSYDDYLWNFQLSSLFRWAWTFRQVRMSGLYLNLERFRPGEHRFGNLADSFPKSSSEDKSKSDQPPRLPRIIVHKLQLENGRLGLKDHLGEGDFEAEFGPINIQVSDFSTLPDQAGQQQVSISTQAGGRISWQGDLQVSPLRSQGSLTMTGKGLEEMHRYLNLMVPFTTSGEDVEASFDYKLAKEHGSPLELSVDNFTARASDIRLTLPGDSAEVIRLPELELSGGSMRWPQQTARLAGLTMTSPELNLLRKEDGSLNLAGLLPAREEGKTSANTGEKQKALQSWNIELAEFSIKTGLVNIQDLSTQAGGEIAIEALELFVSDINNQPDTIMALKAAFNLASGGTVQFAGEASVLPLVQANGQLNVEALELMLTQPWVNEIASVSIDSGSLSLSGDVVHAPDELFAYRGPLQINNLGLTDSARQEKLAGWGGLNINRLEISLGNNSLSTSELEFSQPHGRLAIAQDKTTNFKDLMVRKDSKTSASGLEGSASESKPFEIVIGGFEIEDASLDFSDLSLPLPFEAAIRSMDGTISTLSTVSAEPARIQLEGQVNEFGLAKIAGSINATSFNDFTDVQMTFRNLEMARLTPYTIQFAGHEIDAGRLDLDLDYKIKKGQMQGENNIVVRELTLGDKVDHPDAVSLPLGLAVALLKDSEGVIDIDLPVSGDLNDPEFRIGGIVAKAIFNLITKIITSPFRLLGKLVGVDSEDFGTLSFAAGSAEVSPPDREKLLKMAQAMQQRPELQLAISGVYAPDSDSAALKTQRVDAQLEVLIDAQEQSSEELTKVIRRQVMESLFRESHPDTSLELVQTEFMQSAESTGDDTTPALDETAYVEELRQRIIQKQVVTDAELVQLAELRASNLIAVLNGDEGNTELPIERKEIKEVSSEQANLVPLELEVSTREAR